MARSAPSILRNLSAYVLTAGLQMAIPVLTVPVFTRCIRPEHYGILDLFQTVMALGVGLGNWGMVNAFERYYFAHAGSKEKQLRLLRTVVTFSLVCFGVVLLALLFARDRVASYLTRQDQWGLLLLVFVGTGCLSHVNSFFFIYFKNAEKAGSYALYEAGRAILVAGLSLGLVAGLGYGLWGLVAPSLAIQAVLLGVFLVRFGLVRPGIDLGMLKEMLLYGWPLGAMIFAGIITTNVDRIMLGKMLPEDKAMGVLGVYGRAQGLAIVLFLFMTTVQNVYAPRWSKILFQIEGEGQRSLAALFTEYVCLVIVPAAMLALFCQEIVRVMTPPAYRGMTPLVIALVAYYALLAFGKLLGPVGSFLKMTKYIAVVTLAVAVLTVALNWVLIPRYESAGAVMTTCIVGLGALAFGMWYFGRRFTVRYEKARLAALYGGFFVCGAGAMACYYGVVTYWPGLALRILLGIGFLSLWLKVVGVHRVRLLLADLKKQVVPPQVLPETPAEEVHL